MIRDCDLHGSALGFSGSMGNAVRITNNHVYGNTTGISSDTLSAAGHPGFPTDSSEIDHNLIYSNNLNLYVADPPVDPLVAVPLGTGIIYAGMNDARVHDNWIFDNWRNGAMLFTIPDAFTTAAPRASSSPASRARARRQAGFDLVQQPLLRQPGRQGAAWLPLPRRGRHVRQRACRRRCRAENRTESTSGGTSFPSNAGNCWFGNTGSDGTAASVTGPGAAGRLPGDPPQTLPSDCATSVGPSTPSS